MKKQQVSSVKKVPEVYEAIRAGIVDLLKTARAASARSVNAVMTATYWEIGRRIVEQEQRGTPRATYGDELIKRLANDLTAQFGRGFGVVNLSQMKRFFLTWPDKKIFQTLSEKSSKPHSISNIRESASNVLAIGDQFPLPWSAYVRLLTVKRPEAKIFYEAEALRSGWSVRQLDRQIQSQFYERATLSKNKAAMLKKAARAQPSDTITPEEAIKDPFILEFLNLKDEYSESELEEALISHLAEFLLELGEDFAFVGRQRRLRIDDNWFRIDLIFFHRRLRCLVIIDLKVGKFSYSDAGQMHLYLNYARENWVRAGENPPVGLILCAEKGAAEAHYALDNLPNKVLAAEYQTILPDEKLIAAELNKSRRELESRNRNTKNLKLPL
jgi:predicted nuclease of restriction endonuclease-like (RecB) superfamily